MIARKKNYFEVNHLRQQHTKDERRWDKNENRKILMWKHIRLEETMNCFDGPFDADARETCNLTSLRYVKKNFLNTKQTKNYVKKSSRSTIADDEATSTMEKEYFCIDIL